MATVNRSSAWLQKPPHGVEVDWSHPLAQHLRGFWLLTDGVGSSATNLVNPATSGTLGGTTSPTWTASAMGGGLNFTAGGEQVNCGRGAFLDDLAAETFETLVYVRSLTGYSQRLIAKQDNGTGYNSLFLNSSGDLQFTRARATTNTDYATNTSTLAAGNWYHLIATFDSVANVGALYINGIAPAYATSAGGSGALTTDASLDLLLGNRPDNSRTLDGVMVYARVFATYCTSDMAMDLYAYPYAMMMPTPPTSAVFAGFGNTQPRLPALGIG